MLKYARELLPGDVVGVGDNKQLYLILSASLLESQVRLGSRSVRIVVVRDSGLVTCYYPEGSMVKTV